MQMEPGYDSRLRNMIYSWMFVYTVGLEMMKKNSLVLSSLLLVGSICDDVIYIYLCINTYIVLDESCPRFTGRKDR